jgi:hypothetical protein
MYYVKTLCLNKKDKMHDYTNKFATNMYKLNKDINMVYKNLVHKIYTLVHKIYTMQQLKEIQINCMNYNFRK